MFLRHLRGAPTSYVRHTVRGKVRHEGIGQSFWYRPLTAVLSEVPVDDRELPLLFHARTADFAFVSDPPHTSKGLFGWLGYETNGAYAPAPAATPTA